MSIFKNKMQLNGWTLKPYFYDKDYAVIPHLQEKDCANGEVFLLLEILMVHL